MSRRPQTRLAALALLPLLSSAALAEAPRTVTAHGHAEASAPNDSAEVVVGVRATGEDAPRTANRVDAAAQVVVEAMARAGVARGDVATVGYELAPQSPLAPDQARPQGPLGHPFEARVWFAATVADGHRAGAVLAAAIGAGATDVGGIRMVPRRDPARDVRLRAEAVRDAHEVAVAMAEAAGSRLGPVRSIAPSGGGVVRPAPPAPRPAPSARAVAPPPVLGEATTVSADVDVTWDVAPEGVTIDCRGDCSSNLPLFFPSDAPRPPATTTAPVPAR